MSTENTPNTETQPNSSEGIRQVESALNNQGDNVRASWNFSTDSIRANIAYMSPEAKELLVWAFTWCIDPAHPLRLEEFCDRIGYNKNTVYKWFSGKYRHPETKQLMDLGADAVKAIKRWKRVEVERAKLGRNRFVVTPTAGRVFKACDLSRESQTPVFLEGASHIGKTEAFRQYCIDNNHGKSVLIELEGVNGLQGLIRAVAKKLGIGGGNITDLIERIKRAVTSDMVIIFDEVHLLANTYRRGSFFACIEWIRRLYDATQCGIVLSFTRLGFSVAEQERKRELEQMFRRGVHRMNLGDMPTTADVKMVLESWALEMPARHDEYTISLGREDFTEKPYEMLKQLAKEQGLKAITERLRYAAKLAADHEADLTWEHVLTAHVSIVRNGVAPKDGWAA